MLWIQAFVPAAPKGLLTSFNGFVFLFLGAWLEKKQKKIASMSWTDAFFISVSDFHPA